MPVGEPFGDVLEALVLNRGQADTICNSSEHHFLILGDQGVGKSWLVEAVRRRKEARANAKNRELIFFQFSGDESLYPEMVLDRLKGKSKRFGPLKGASFGRPQGEVSLELVFPTTVKLSGKLGSSPQSQEPPSNVPNDKDIQIRLLNETHAARTYLENLTKGNQNLLQRFRDKLGLKGKGVPDVMVVFDNFNDPILVRTLNGLFKAYRVFFLVTGGWRLADMWWEEKWKPGSTSALLANFLPVYLPLVWDVETISERWVDYSSITDRRLFKEFLQYVAISGRGRLREIGNELNRCADREMDESEFAPEAELYDILRSPSVRQSIVDPLSRFGHRDDWYDRALWCLCYLAHEFSKQLTPFAVKDIEAASKPVLEQIIPSQEDRLWLIDSWLHELAAGDWRFLRKSERKKAYEYTRPITTPIKCPNPQCGRDRHRPAAQHCVDCGTRLPVPRKPSGILCPNPTCGLRNRPSAKFCYKCGAPITAPIPSVMPAPRYRTGELPSAAILGNRYVIVLKLTQGGMGAIYKAFDNRLKGRTVVIKEMSLTFIEPSEQPQIITAFRREAEILALLDHPNLVKVFDLFEEYDRHYMVMELIQGRSLLEILEKDSPGGLTEDQVLAWAEQLCDVLAYLHSQQPRIIYRDLKPGNVMELTGTTRIKLIDFGIARFYKPGKRRDTVTFGTPGYAAPEQYGPGQTDERSDIYSLGATLHHLLTGHDPSVSPFNLPSVRNLNVRVSQRVNDAIARAVAVRREDRFPSMAEMKAALLGK